MTLCISYRQLRRSTPNPSLGGRWVQPRPLIPVTLIGVANTWLGEGIVDSGSDETVFPEAVARFLGVDLQGCDQGIAESVGGARFTIRRPQLSLRLADNQERRQWDATIGFTTARLRHPLLGFGGFLQYFTATFHGDRELIELRVNTLYPGT